MLAAVFALSLVGRLQAATVGLGMLPVELPSPIVATLPTPETETVEPTLAVPMAKLEAVRELVQERSPEPSSLARVFDGGKQNRAVEGLFGPDSMMWRINGHQLGRFGGFAALATQATHPLVAEATKVSRKLLQDPHRRLLRTMVLIERIMFADRATALDAVRQVNRRHAEIEGELEQGVGRFPAGTPFRAKDPELLKYVLATTYHNTRLYYETFVSKLTEAERERYYQEFKYFGRLLGIPSGLLPAGRAGFDEYVERMLASEDLAVGSTAKELAAAFLKQPKLPWGLGPFLDIPVSAAMRLVTGLLPKRIRVLNGLPWTLKDRLLFPLQLRTVKLALSATPEALLRTPAYYRAMWRVKTSGLP